MMKRLCGCSCRCCFCFERYRNLFYCLRTVVLLSLHRILCSSSNVETTTPTATAALNDDGQHSCVAQGSHERRSVYVERKLKNKGVFTVIVVCVCVCVSAAARAVWCNTIVEIFLRRALHIVCMCLCTVLYIQGVA